jgi:hypothetical protein
MMKPLKEVLMKPKEFLESVFESVKTSKQFHFNDIVTAVNKLGEMKKPGLPPPPWKKDTEPFFIKLLQSKLRIPLHPRSSVPHGMSPEDMLKFLILKKLIEADPGNAERLRPVLEKAKKQAGSITLKRIIDSYLKAKKPAGPDPLKQFIDSQLKKP